MSTVAGFLVTCEHAGNEVPSDYAHVFAGSTDVLNSHRGWDDGALEFAERLSDMLDAPLLCHRVTRLLVDTNRPETHPRVFSEWTRSLPCGQRTALLDAYHRPHWGRVRDALDTAQSRYARVIHLGVHTFTPVLAGHERKADFALLYDPARDSEKQFCDDWFSRLRRALPTLRLRRNYPYRGSDAGLTTCMRKEFVEGRYLGIEVELNQGSLPLLRSALGPIAQSIPA